MNEVTAISLDQHAYSAAASAFLARRPQLFIANEWVDSSHGKTLAVEDPSSGKEVARIVDASEADINRAVAAAREAFDDARWSGLAQTCGGRARTRGPRGTPRPRRAC